MHPPNRKSMPKKQVKQSKMYASLKHCHMVLSVNEPQKKVKKMKRFRCCFFPIAECCVYAFAFNAFAQLLWCSLPIVE